MQDFGILKALNYLQSLEREGSPPVMERMMLSIDMAISM